MNIFTKILTTLEGIPADAYDDEPVGAEFWKDPKYEWLYRPFGVDYRIVFEGGRMLLEIQLKDGRWVEAQEYNPGYDSYGKLRKGAWGPMPGSRADSREHYRRVGNGLTGKSVPPERVTLFSSEARP